MRVIEKFINVNGEGMKSGELSVFIRLAGCNLRCSYCDTLYSLLLVYDLKYKKRTAPADLTLSVRSENEAAGRKPQSSPADSLTATEV